MFRVQAESVFSLETSIKVLENMGFFDVVLPFLLVFSIVYGALESADIFKQKNIHAVIALSLAFIATGSSYFTGTLKSFTPIVGVILFFMLSFLVTIGLVAGEETRNLLSEDWFKYPTIAISAGVLLFTFGVSQGLWSLGVGEGVRSFLNPSFFLLFVLGVVFIAMIFLVLRGGEED